MDVVPLDDEMAYGLASVQYVPHPGDEAGWRGFTAGDYLQVALAASLGGKKVVGASLNPSCEVVRPANPVEAARRNAYRVSILPTYEAGPGACSKKGKVGEFLPKVTSQSVATQRIVSNVRTSAGRRAASAANLGSMLMNGGSGSEIAMAVATAVCGGSVDAEVLHLVSQPESFAIRQAAAAGKPGHALFGSNGKQTHIAIDDTAMQERTVPRNLAMDHLRPILALRVIAQLNAEIDPDFRHLLQHNTLPFFLVRGSMPEIERRDYRATLPMIELGVREELPKLPAAIPTPQESLEELAMATVAANASLAAMVAQGFGEGNAMRLLEEVARLAKRKEHKPKLAGRETSGLGIVGSADYKVTPHDAVALSLKGTSADKATKRVLARYAAQVRDYNKALTTAAASATTEAEMQSACQKIRALLQSGGFWMEVTTEYTGVAPEVAAERVVAHKRALFGIRSGTILPRNNHTPPDTHIRAIARGVKIPKAPRVDMPGLISGARLDAGSAFEELLKRQTTLRKRADHWATKYSLKAEQYKGWAKEGGVDAVCPISGRRVIAQLVYYRLMASAMRMVRDHGYPLDDEFLTCHYNRGEHPDWFSKTITRYARQAQLTLEAILEGAKDIGGGLITADSLAGSVDALADPSVKFTKVLERARNTLQGVLDDARQAGLHEAIRVADEELNVRNKALLEAVQAGDYEEAQELFDPSTLPEIAEDELDMLGDFGVEDAAPQYDLLIATYPSVQAAERAAQMGGFLTFQDAVDALGNEARDDDESELSQRVRAGFEARRLQAAEDEGAEEDDKQVII